MTQQELAPTPYGQPVSKVDKFKWKPLDGMGEFALIPKDQIHVDDSYQRRVSDPKTLKIAANWSWRSMGVISVSMRADGSFYCIDGQHRVLAALKRADIRELPCLVFEIDTIKDEAKAFLDMNWNRTSVYVLDKFNALLEAQDPTALGVNQMVRESGYFIRQSTQRNSVACIGELMAAFQADSATCKKVFTICVEVAQGESFPNKFFTGLFWLERFLASQTKESLTLSKHRQRLILAGVKNTLRAIAEAQAYHGKAGARVYACGIAKMLNKGRQEGGRIPLE